MASTDRVWVTDYYTNKGLTYDSNYTFSEITGEYEGNVTDPSIEKNGYSQVILGLDPTVTSTSTATDIYSLIERISDDRVEVDYCFTDTCHYSGIHAYHLPFCHIMFLNLPYFLIHQSFKLRG